MLATRPSPLHAFLEPRVRRVASDLLGVDPEDLTQEVSLVRDLAADSLDLLELVSALEAELDLSLPDDVFDRVETYGELVAVVAALSREGTPPTINEFDAPGFSARVAAPRGSRVIERSGSLTAYAAETLAEDAKRTGSGARLEINLQGGASDTFLAKLRERLGGLRDQGVPLYIRRNGRQKQPSNEKTQA